MHGLTSKDMAHLMTLQSCQVIYVGIGEHMLQFNLHPTGDLSIEGRCELLSATGEIIDVWDAGRRSDNFRFCDILGQTIERVDIDTPKSFVTKLSGGSNLRVIDNSEQWESFSVNGLYV